MITGYNSEMGKFKDNSTSVRQAVREDKIFIGVQSILTSKMLTENGCLAKKGLKCEMLTDKEFLTKIKAHI